MSRNTIQGNIFAIQKTIDNSGIQDAIEEYEHTDVVAEKIIIDSNEAEALLVRKQDDSGDVFVVDNTTGCVISYEDFQLKKLGTSADLVALAKPGTLPSVLFRADIGDDGTVNQEHQIAIDSAVTGDFFIKDTTTAQTYFTYDVSEGDMKLNPAASILVDSPLEFQDGTTNAPAVSFQSAPDVGWKHLLATIPRWAFVAGGAEIFDINASGIDVRDTKNICFETGEYCIGRNNVAIGSITNTNLTGDVLQIEIPNSSTNGFQIHNANNAALFEMQGTASGKTFFKQSIEVPLDSTIYNSGNDGLKINDTGSYTSLVTSGFENIRANSVESFYRSALHTFTPTTVLNTTVTYNFQVGDGVSSYVNLLSLTESLADFNVPLDVLGGVTASGNFTTGSTGNLNNGAGESVTFTATETKLRASNTDILVADANRVEAVAVPIKFAGISSEPLGAYEEGDTFYYTTGDYLITFNGSTWRKQDGTLETFV